jgi:hypothetical protein
MKVRKKAKDKKPKMNEEWLTKAFRTVNCHFFDNEVPGTTIVKFKKDCGHRLANGEYKRADAYYDHERETIFLDDMLAYFPDMATIALAHEMSHAHLRFKGYTGWPVDCGHGTIFQLEIGRLWKAGFYDGLLTLLLALPILGAISQWAMC